MQIFYENTCPKTRNNWSNVGKWVSLGLKIYLSTFVGKQGRALCRASGVECPASQLPINHSFTRGTVFPSVWWGRLNASQIASICFRGSRFKIDPTLKIVLTSPDGRDVRPTRRESLKIHGSAVAASSAAPSIPASLPSFAGRSSALSTWCGRT